MLLTDLVKAGKPIFIEKPLAGCVAVGEKILSALAGSGAWIMVGYHKRSDPASAYAKAVIDKLKTSGEIGKLKYVRICMPAGDWIANGFSDLINIKEEVQVKLEWDPPAEDMTEAVYKEYIKFVNFYIHQVNLMRFLLGEPYRVTFADRAGVLLAGESQSGVTVTIEMTPYQTTIDWQESALVAFERGYVKLELPAPLAMNRPGRVEVMKDPGKGVVPTTMVPTLPWVSAMRQQAINFVASVRGERKPPCEAAEALEDLKVALEYIRLWKM